VGESTGLIEGSGAVSERCEQRFVEPG